MKNAMGLFKYLDASKLVFFERCLVLLTPPIYLNDAWDFLPKGRVLSEREILNVLRSIETDIARSSVVAVPVNFARRERSARLKKLRVDCTSKESLAEQGKYYQDQISKVVGVVSLTILSALSATRPSPSDFRNANGGESEKTPLCHAWSRGIKHVQRQITDIDPETGELVLKPHESHQ